MAYIKCNNLTLGYEGKTVTENLNFEVNEGDYLCIVGENGAGKSTLMKTLLHLMNPISGDITYGNNIKPYEIGYLPQQTVVQKDFPASIYEVVLSGTLNQCGLRPFYSKKEKVVAKQNMERLEIWNMRNRCYRELSGGQQQRVLLARALCATQKLLLLDEPVAGLDPKVTSELYQLIKELNESGVTIIMISHDIQASVIYASHILHVGKEQMFIGTKEDYVQSEIGRMFCGNADGNAHENVEKEGGVQNG